MADADFNFATIFEWERARLNMEASTGLTTDGDLVVHFTNVPEGSYEAAVDWVKSNWRTVSNPVVEQQTFNGTYRLVKVDSVRKKVKDRGVTTDVAYQSDAIVITFRHGWITALIAESVIDFSEARLVNSKLLEGNAEAIAGIDNTTSDDPERFLLMEWPNCSADHDAAILLSFGAVSTYVNPACDGQTHTGTWHKVYATSERAEDKSTTIKVLWALPQYTLNAYEAFNTVWAKDRTYLWNVPKDQAQAILTAYSAANDGASASCSYSTEAGLVDIVLTDASVAKDNLTTDAIDINCDTSVVYHFAWGYTKDELGVFLAAHDDPIPGVGNANEGMTRKIDISIRGDGLFDSIIEERTFGPHSSPATPDFTITVPTGNKITKLQGYGWNLRSSELAAVKAVYDTTVDQIGRTCTFRISRQDDCSFDYEGTITDVDAIVATSTIPISVANGGTGLIIETGKYADAAEIANIASGYPSLVRKRTTVRLTPNDDETTSYEVVQQEVQEVEGSLASSGTGVDIDVSAGRNVDTTNLAAVTVTSAPRKRIDIELAAQDDKSYNYTVKERTVLKTDESSATDDDGIKETIYGGANVDSGDLPTLASSKRVRPQWIRFDIQDDGTINYVGKETTVKASSANAGVGRKYLDVDLVFAKNQDNIPSLTQPTTVGQSLDLRSRFNDDGSVDYDQRTEQKAEITTDVEAGSLVKTLTWLDGKGDITGGPANVAAATGISTYFEVSVNDDGSVDYKKTVIDSVPRKSTDDIGGAGSSSIILSKLVPKYQAGGYEDTAIIFRHVLVANIPDITTGGTTYGYIQQIKMEDDFTFSGIAIIRDYADTFSYGGGDDVSVEDLLYADTDHYTITKWAFSPQGTHYRTFTYVIEEKWEDDYTDAADWLRSATGPDSDTTPLDGSKISYRRVNGTYYWHIFRVHPPAASGGISAWVELPTA